MEEKIDPRDRFGQLLMENLRDEVMFYCEMACEGKWAVDDKLQQDLKKLSPELKSVVKRCVLASIDYGIHEFLAGMQWIGKDMQIIIDGQNVLDEDKYTEEFKFHLFGDDGWPARFSKYGKWPEEY